VKESLSGGPAPELFQFRPQGPHSFSASQSDPDLFIWERAAYVLARAEASLQSLLCKSIHLDVYAILKGTIPPFLFIISV
jgi:hypothetical protein